MDGVIIWALNDIELKNKNALKHFRFRLRNLNIYFHRLFEFRKIISNRERCRYLVPSNYPVEITKVSKSAKKKTIEKNAIL